MRVSAVAPGCDQAAPRPSPSDSNRSRSAAQRDGLSAPMAARRSSWRCASASRSFHRRSSSAATSRFAGSTASYRRAGEIGLKARLRQRQLRLAPRLGDLRVAHRHRREGGLDAERAQEPQGLGRDRRVDPHAAEGDAGLRPVVEVRAAARAARAEAARAAVGDVEPSPAMAAAQQAGEQRVAPADRAARHQAAAVGVVGDQALVPLELRPGDVALVVIHDQHVPLVALPAVAAHHPLAPVLDRHPARRPAKGIGAGVRRGLVRSARTVL